jgi:two-component system LytT family response regulator
MLKKLRAIAVDDDSSILSTLEQMCKESQLVELIQTFTDPIAFLKQAQNIDFDLCLLDLQMPEIEGTAIAQQLKNKPVIFISGSDERFKEALDLSPIDVVPKPILKDRLYKAFEKAHALLVKKIEYGLFNVAESKRKVKLRLGDIMLLTTDESDSRNKEAWMRSGEKYTLMNYRMEELLSNSPSLVQVNRAEAVSLEVINDVDRDQITLKGVLADNGKPKQVTLGLAFQKKFIELMFHC